MKNIIIQLLISVELVFFIYAEYIGKLDLSQGGPTLTYRQLCRE